MWHCTLRNQHKSHYWLFTPACKQSSIHPLHANNNFSFMSLTHSLLHVVYLFTHLWICFCCFTACSALFSMTVFFLCLSSSLICEHNNMARNPSHPVAVSLVPYECEMDCYSEGQPGISYPRVRQDLASMGFYNWLMGHCFVSLLPSVSNLFCFVCVVPISAQFECLLLLSLTAPDCDLCHTHCLCVCPSISVNSLFLSLSVALASR